MYPGREEHKQAKVRPSRTCNAFCARMHRTFGGMPRGPGHSGKCMPHTPGDNAHHVTGIRRRCASHGWNSTNSSRFWGARVSQNWAIKFQKSTNSSRILGECPIIGQILKFDQIESNLGWVSQNFKNLSSHDWNSTRISKFEFLIFCQEFGEPWLKF